MHAVADQVNSSDRAPRITSARQLDCLRHELAGLLTDWDHTSNQVLWMAAGALREAMTRAQTMAYAPRRQWLQQRYEEESR